MHDTEDKRWWVDYGKALEHKFVDLCVNMLGIDACINPAKQEDKLAPDLVVNGRVADLKTQHTPFFLAQKFAGIPPTYAVTFNRIDYIRYNKLYPDIDIYFWIDWKVKEMSIRGTVHTVDDHNGIYLLPFVEVSKLIDNGAYEHGYAKRIYDTKGNAKSSYVLDIRQFVRIK